MKTDQNKTLVKVSKETAEVLIDNFGINSIGINSNGEFTAYQYKLDELNKATANEKGK